MPPAPTTIPEPIEEVEEEEIEEKTESEVVRKIESEVGEASTELDAKKGEELEEERTAIKDSEKEDSVAPEEAKSSGDDSGTTGEGEKIVEEAEEASEDSEKTTAPEEPKSNVDESKEIGIIGGETNHEDEMETEVDEKKVEIESENSKTEENTSEGESEKENVSAEDVVNSVEGAAEEIAKDDSFSSAACAVIGSTNALISSLRQEMAARNSLVAPKQIPRQKPKSGKFWKEERSAFR